MIRFVGVLGFVLLASLTSRSTDAVTATITETSPSIEISADDGIEWERTGNVVHARGNATATRGDVTVSADVLSAHYRESATGKREIWRLEANGDVIIDRNGERAFSEHVVYEVDDNKVTLTGGRPNRLVSDEGEVSAEEQIEYWAEERKLVARGNAVAQENERQVQASVITAYLRETQEGAIGLQRVDATGGVRLVTQNDVVRAEQGSYDAVRRIATVSGSVRITRGGNQLNGCRGEVDLNTGINRLLPCADNTGTGSRVHGLIDPEAARQRTQAR